MALDFDGTLSEFALSPSDAVIAPDALPPLVRLARSLPLTAVVSGRAAQDVAARVGIPTIVYVGNHGAERIIDGELAAAPNAHPDRNEMQRLLNRVRQALENDEADDSADGFVWENKSFSATIHYRAAADEARAAQRLSAALKTIPEIAALDAFWGNKVVEMRHRNAPNKGAVLTARDIAERLSELADKAVRGSTVDHRQVQLPQSLRELGTVAVPIRLTRNVQAEVSVEVRPDEDSMEIGIAEFVSELEEAEQAAETEGEAAEAVEAEPAEAAAQ